MSAREKVLVALLDGARIRARKAGPFAPVKYEMVARIRDEITGDLVQREQFVVSESTVASMAKAGLLDTREAIKTFTENSTEYFVTLTDLGVDEARSVKLSAKEVARAG